jgi:hypothetical protein
MRPSVPGQIGLGGGAAAVPPGATAGRHRLDEVPVRRQPGGTTASFDLTLDCSAAPGVLGWKALRRGVVADAERLSR